MAWITFNEGDRVKADGLALIGTVTWVHPHGDEVAVRWDDQDPADGPDVMSANELDRVRGETSGTEK